MNVLVTGASGYVGIPLVKRLASNGAGVRALCRSEEKSVVFSDEKVEIYFGDILEKQSLIRAMSGCDQVYHLASYARMWDKNPEKFMRVNAEGCRTVLETAQEAGISRVVVTSTAGVMGPASNFDELVNEEKNKNLKLLSEYDRSKKKAEDIALDFVSDSMEVVLVNPSRIYGPGLKGESNSVSRLIELFANGRWRFVPGDGSSIGNYVFIDDVVEGHLLAMEKGKSGERYILGGDNLSYNDLFTLLRVLTGNDKRLYKIPLSVLRTYARWEMLLARTFRKKPAIVPEFVEKLTMNWSLSIEKARADLGYQPLPMEAGVRKTLHWLGYE